MLFVDICVSLGREALSIILIVNTISFFPIKLVYFFGNYHSISLNKPLLRGVLCTHKKHPCVYLLPSFYMSILQLNHLQEIGKTNQVFLDIFQLAGYEDDATFRRRVLQVFEGEQQANVIEGDQQQMQPVQPTIQPALPIIQPPLPPQPILFTPQQLYTPQHQPPQYMTPQHQQQLPQFVQIMPPAANHYRKKGRSRRPYRRRNNNRNNSDFGGMGNMGSMGQLLFMKNFLK